MAGFLIEGHRRLQGEILVHGAKNSTLPISVASVLYDTETVLHNCPILSDMGTYAKVLRYLRCRVIHNGGDVAINFSGISHSDTPDYLVREMRSSIAFLGTIVARTGRAKPSFPGGRELGPRPIDLYLAMLRRMGVEIEEDHGCLDCSTPDELKGAKTGFSFPSVSTIENVMIVTVCAKGITIITNAARKPEICDLASFLSACGAKVRGTEESTIMIEDVAKLSGCEHSVISDRVTAATYMAAAAVTGNTLLISRIDPRHLEPMVPTFEENGCSLMFCEGELKITAPQWLQPVRSMRTVPHPGFPTNTQAPMMAMTTLANGTSVFVENIPESRYKHVGELLCSGASIKVEDRMAVMQGVPRLSGAPVESPDLWGGAAPVIAGLAAEGITRVEGLRHTDRSYKQMELSSAAAGVSIQGID